mmetsp:Transcript_2197/g.6046  ORF Transcript_2197/g.6046 Transcript_2197/m.6046 type:complete len:279 (-) Transcript_2197:368-1204(-)
MPGPLKRVLGSTPTLRSSSLSEEATQEGVDRDSTHSASPVSLCLKSGALGFRLVARLSQKSSGEQKSAAHRPSMSFDCTDPPPKEDLPPPFHDDPPPCWLADAAYPPPPPPPCCCQEPPPPKEPLPWAAPPATRATLLQVTLTLDRFCWVARSTQELWLSRPCTCTCCPFCSDSTSRASSFQKSRSNQCGLAFFPRFTASVTEATTLPSSKYFTSGSRPRRPIRVTELVFSADHSTSSRLPAALATERLLLARPTRRAAKEEALGGATKAWGRWGWPW